MQQTTGRLLARGAIMVAMLCATSLPMSLPSPAEAAPTRADLRKPVAKGVGLARPAVRRGPVLQCVAFARDASGIHLSGNAHTWWHNAAGQFLRGQQPERGAVLNFRASGGMRMGHVSVVSRVLSDREILIDDANWAAPGQRKGMVRRGASVIDVSPNNDWTEVRVANGIGSWGRVYPTYGFIYPRADRDAERIEIAAARDAQPSYQRTAPPAAPRTTLVGVLAPSSPEGFGGTVALPTAQGWTWARPPAAPASSQAAPAGWVWTNGQAMPR
jgi:hypothetical protein